MAQQRLTGFWRGRRAAADGVVTVFLGLMATLSVVNQFRVNDEVGVPLHQTRPVSLLLVWLCVAPVALRRLFPIVSYTACVAAFVATRILEVPESTVTVVALAVSFISVGVHGDPRRRTPARVAAAVALLAMYVFAAARASARADLGAAFDNLLVFDLIFSTLLIAASWVLGETWRQRAEHGRDLAARTIELDDERRLNAERAVVEERLRIARELHDVLAHHVSVMGVHAAAAGRILDRDPGRARQSLSLIESSSRQAIDEFRRLVGFLRSGAGGDGDTGPHPGLDRCTELVAEAERDGLEVDLRITGDPSPLPSGVDLSAFRIIQESLTNTRKHAEATRVAIDIRYRPTELDITVVDDGCGPPADRPGPPAGPSAGTSTTGLGLIGMRERLRLHEGRFEAGAAPGGGYRVHATFPLRSSG